MDVETPGQVYSINPFGTVPFPHRGLKSYDFETFTVTSHWHSRSIRMLRPSLRCTPSIHILHCWIYLVNGLQWFLECYYHVLGAVCTWGFIKLCSCKMIPWILFLQAWGSKKVWFVQGLQKVINRRLYLSVRKLCSYKIISSTYYLHTRGSKKHNLTTGGFRKDCLYIQGVPERQVLLHKWHSS